MFMQAEKFSSMRIPHLQLVTCIAHLFTLLTPLLNGGSIILLSEITCTLRKFYSLYALRKLSRTLQAIAYIGGVLFLVFAAVTLIEIVS